MPQTNSKKQYRVLHNVLYGDPDLARRADVEGKTYFGDFYAPGSTIQLYDAEAAPLLASGHIRLQDVAATK